jgi:hypothetical protein
MLHIIVGHQLLPTTLKIFTHMDHVHIALILTIVQVIIHSRDNFAIFHMSNELEFLQSRV